MRAPGAAVALAIAGCLLSDAGFAGAGDDGRQTAGLPLDARRSISFETDEGTWLSLDVAPDGRSIIFDLLGDIYILDIGGGIALPLLTGVAFESQPVFSPDGGRIAFVSDRDGANNVWIANRDGGALARVTDSRGVEIYSSPVFAPDGRSLYVSKSRAFRGEPFDLWSYRIDDPAGAQGSPVGGNPSSRGQGGWLATQVENATDAAVSPDGRYLYFTYQHEREGATKCQPCDIRRMDLHSGENEVVLAPPDGAFRPVLAPDGKRLVYGSRVENETVLRVRHLQTGEDRLLARVGHFDMQGGNPSRGKMPGFDFTADGKAVVVSRQGRISRIDVDTGVIADIPFKARVALEVGPALRLSQKDPGGPVRARIIQAPAQSPDGRRLAFSALGRLYAMPLNGRRAQTPTRLTSSEALEFQPAWSPDGKWIAYVTWSTDSGGHIWKMRADGRGEPRRLTTADAWYSSPIFSPDGAEILALRYPTFDRARLGAGSEIGWYAFPTPRDVIAVPVGGGEARRIFSGSAFGGRDSSDPRILHFSGDGRRIYFRDGEALHSVGRAGEGRRKIIEITANSWRWMGFDAEHVSGIRMSPDGKWALALEEQLYLVAVPPSAGGAVVDIRQPPGIAKKLTDGRVDYMDWADGGRTIVWSVGSSFYRRPLADVDLGNPGVDDPVHTERFVADVEVPRDGPQGALLLRGAIALTMRGAEIIEDADILIEGNRMAAIGKRGSFPVPSGASVRELGGRYVTPGFIDTHRHWSHNRRQDLEVPWEYAMDLAYGITTGLDVQTSTNDMFAYQDMIDAGMFVGSRGYNVGRGIYPTNDFGSLDDVRAVLRQYRDDYGTRNIKVYFTGNRRLRQQIVNVSRELGLMPTAEGAWDLALDLTHALDGIGNEHPLVAAPLYRDMVQLFARSGVGYTPTLLSGHLDLFVIEDDPLEDPKVRRFMPCHVLEGYGTQQRWTQRRFLSYEHLAAGAAAIFREGGHVGVGGHGEFAGLGYHWEMRMLSSGGLTPHEVLQIATRGSAAVIGREPELGTLEPGKYADLIIFEGNPLRDIREALRIGHVMKNGRLYVAETLDEVWPRRREYRLPFAPSTACDGRRAARSRPPQA